MLSPSIRSLAVFHYAAGLSLVMVLAAGAPVRCAAAEDKVHAVGKEGLTLEGKVALGDPKVKVIASAGK